MMTPPDDGEDSPQGEAGGGLALWTDGIGQSYLAVLIQTHQCILGQLGGRGGDGIAGVVEQLDFVAGRDGQSLGQVVDRGSGGNGDGFPAFVDFERRVGGGDDHRSGGGGGGGAHGVADSSGGAGISGGGLIRGGGGFGGRGGGVHGLASVVPSGLTVVLFGLVVASVGLVVGAGFPASGSAPLALTFRLTKAACHCS